MEVARWARPGFPPRSIASRRGGSRLRGDYAKEIIVERRRRRRGKPWGSRVTRQKSGGAWRRRRRRA